MRMDIKGQILSEPSNKWYNYKPYIIRVSGLLLALTVALSLIGVLEYAARSLPSTEKENHISRFAPRSLQRNRRQDGPFQTSQPFIGTFAPGAYLSTIETLTLSQMALPSPTTSIVTIFTFPGAYVATASTIVSSAAAPGSYVPTITTVTNPSALSSQGKNSSNSHPTDTVVLSWPLWKVFVGGYLPVFLAIVFKVFWTSIYANIKLIEPFIQLSRPDGALAEDAFWTFYLSSNLKPIPIIALSKRRWLMFWTSVVYLLVGFLPPLASESLFRDTNYNCSNPNPAEPQNPCWPRLSVDRTIIRLLQGLLSFIAVMTLMIMFMLSRSPTGIASDPSSVAFVATLIHHPEVLADFRALENEDTSRDISNFIGKKCYHLGSYLGRDGVERYGILPSNSYMLGGNIGTTQALEQINAPKTKKFKAFLDGAFIIFVLGLLGVIVAYFKDGSDDSFNRFFTSNSFGPRFFMSTMGTIISLNFKRIERGWSNPNSRAAGKLSRGTEVQTSSPFHRLAQSHSPAGPTILLRQNKVPFGAFVMLFAQGYFFSASVAFTSALAEILVVVLAAIPYSPGEIFLELIICAYTSIGILSLMVIVLASLVFWRRQLPYLPRTPDTLGGVISYICGSRMLGDFEGCEGLESRQLERRIAGLGEKYTYGEYIGVDGKSRWMIEESTVLSVSG